MLSDSDKKIAGILKEEGVISQKDLEKFYKEELSMNKFLLEVLVEEKKIKVKEIIPLLSKKLGITYLEISDFFIDPSLKKIVPEDAQIGEIDIENK